jgi:hypothetical protein
MSDPDESRGQFGNVSFGNVSGGQVVLGNQNQVTQQNVGLSQEELAELFRGFDGIRAEATAQLPADKQTEALAMTDELQKEVTAEKPDPSRLRRALRWFGENAPALAGQVAHLIGGPLVAKLVEGAGEAVKQEVQKAVAEEL